MTRFTPGNKLAAKPKWSLAEVRAFHRALNTYRVSLNYTHSDLAKALDYSTKYVRLLQGDFHSARQPFDCQNVGLSPCL